MYPALIGILNQSNPFELFLIIGDSNADGRGETVPTVPANTLYVWNGSGIDEITTQSVANDGSYGSAWQEFAIRYKARFNRKVVLVQHGSGGSEFYPNGDDNNWSTSGDLYTPAVSEALAAKAFLGVNRVNVIVCLGINDIRGGQTAVNILAAMVSLRDRLNTDLSNPYSTPNIYYVLPGRDETNFNSQKGNLIRRLIVNLGVDSNAHVAAQTFPYANWGLMNADDIHFTQAGYDLLGEQIFRYMASRSAFHKHARSIIASFKDEPTEAQKTAINTFVNTFAAFSGTVDGFQVYVGASRENIMFDWGLVCCPVDLGDGTFIANDCISMNGTDEYLDTGALQNGDTRSTLTDFIEFVKTGTVGEASGTSAFLFGKSISSSMRVYQATSALHVQAYDATDNSDAAEAKFADDSIYAAARNGTTKMLKKNATNVISTSQASTVGITTQPTYIGTTNGNGTPNAACIQAEFKCWGLFQLSDITWDSTFVSALNALITAMETP